MSTCIRCNKEAGHDIICSNCGLFTNNASPLNATKEESLEVLNIIKTEYLDFFKTSDKKMFDIKHELSNIKTHLPKHMRFKFFWPTLIIIAVAAFIIAFLCGFFGLGEIVAYGFIFIFSIIAVIVGLIIAGKVQTKKNASIFAQEAENYARKKQLENDEKALEQQIQKMKYCLKEMNPVIPLELMNDRGIKEISDKITYGQAENVIDAVSIIKG